MSSAKNTPTGESRSSLGYRDEDYHSVDENMSNSDTFNPSSEFIPGGLDGAVQREQNQEATQHHQHVNSHKEQATGYEQETNDLDSSSHSTSSHQVKEFQPQDDDEYADKDRNQPGNALLKRSPSVIERIQSRLSFFNPTLKSERWKLAKQFLLIYALMIACILGIFSIYWGASYKRNTRLPNLKMLVVIEDNETINGVDPVIGDTLKNVLQSPQIAKLGNWEIQNLTEFNEIAQQYNNTIEQEVKRQIHHQLYWDSIYVPKNASVDFKDYIENPNSQVNISNLVFTIYETGRDFLNMNSYVKTGVNAVQSAFISQQSNLKNIFNESASFSYDQLGRLLTPIQFNAIDMRPWSDTVLVAPSQVGLIYIIILTFFQVNMFGEVHQSVAKFGLKHHHYVLYRIISSYISYFILSLGYSLVTLAFQVDFTVTFGKSGFLVYWMFSYITMISVGIMNELMFMVLLIIYPPLVGFWLLIWVLINISPTFSPIALVPKFYRFGYAMPIHNSYELTKVVFFNTYKGQMGRNIGILFAWIVLATVGFALTIGPFGKIMGKRAMKAKQAQAQAQQKEQEEKQKRSEV